jgi:hypothetical protein
MRELTLQPCPLCVLLRQLVADAEAGRFHSVDEYRVPRTQPAVEKAQLVFGDDYESLGNGGYRHLMTTNSDGESYEEDR